MKKITFFSTFKRTLFCVIILTSLLSTNKVSSQDLLDRNGNGVVEESDYWNTEKSYSDEYLANYNAILLNRSLVYARTLGNGNSNTRNLNPVGTCNLISCGSFNRVDATPEPDWGGFRIGVDGSTYAANVAYSCWNDNGTVDYSEGQYISYSNSEANIDTPGIIEQSPDGDGFAIFSFRNESIDQDISVETNTNYTVCFEIAVIPRYSNDDGDFEEFIPNLQFGISSGGIVISDPLTYTHSDLNVHPASDFPPELSTATNGNDGYQNPGGWTEIDPYWETVCITFKTNNSGSVNVFYATGDPGRSVVLVDGLRLSLEGYANAPELSTDNASFCINSPVDLDNYVLAQDIPNGAELKWSTNSDPSVVSDHLINTTVTPPGTWYAFFYNATYNCFSPAATLTLSSSDLDSSYTQQNVSCFEGSDASIDLTVTGGDPQYTYSWTTNDGSGLNPTYQDQSGLSSGTYEVLVTDNNGCTTSESVTITQPDAALAITGDVTDVGCFGESTGSIDITVIGGTSPYTYLWNTGATSEDISGLSASTYEVLVTDANDCKTTESFDINQPNAVLAVTGDVTDVSCFGESTGSIDITVTGGTSSYTYVWNTGATSEDLSGLSAGTYTVTVTDANNCEISESFDINQPNAVLAVTGDVTDVSCFGESTGSIDITVTGGTSSYTYVWNTGATSEDLSGLAAGTYTVTVTDANNCETSESFVIDQPGSGLLTSYTVVDVLCHNDATGSIDLTVSGGTPDYTYLWSNGATTQDLSGVTAGTYSVIVTDVNDCSVSESGIVIEEPTNPLSIVITKENATTGQGCDDGDATASVSGGTPGYTYLWSASANNQTTATAINLPSGTHTVLVTDANGCELEQGVVIDCSNTCDAIISVDNITDVLCTDDATGSATVSASSIANPQATFTFTWNTVPTQVDAGLTSSTISSLAAGIYTVSVTIDGTVCQPVEQSVTITEPANALNVTATSTDESGPSTGDGTATAVASGGTPNYTYLWSPGGETTAMISGLSAGTYTVSVTDENGCIETATVTVNPGTCLDLTAFAASTPVTCNGDSDGTASATVTGGSGSFTYLWNNGQTTASISGLPGATYTVTVTDTVTQCNTEATTTVNEPNILTSGIAVSNVLCFGDSTGSLDLTVAGGTAPYSFLWNNGAMTEDLNMLPAGTYNVTITDANNCETTDSATIMQPIEGLSGVITSQTDIVCAGLGSVTVTASGGTMAYLYQLDNGAFETSGTFSDLAEGNYIVNILDANGCTTSVDVSILYNCTDAIDDINDTYVNLPVNGNVLTNDVDAEGDTQTVTTTTVTTVQGVVVTIDANTGEYTYTPPTDYEGEDSFEYTICDDGNSQACDTATVYIEILPDSDPLNDPPVANADTNTTEVDTPVTGTVLPNDFDPDGDNIVVTTTTVVTGQGVTVTIDPNTGEYTYTPPAGYTGTDSFEYTICDDGNPVLCDTTTVIITIVDDNTNITVANDDAYNTLPGVAINGNVSDNDNDPEGHDQTVNSTPVSGPSNGSVTLNTDGSFIYTPTDPNFTGTDQFVYSVCDNGNPQACDEATVYITINDRGNVILAIDDINDTYVNMPVSGDVSTNDDNNDGPAGTEVFTLVSGPTAGGNLVFNPDGTYTYTPANDFVGFDTFVYEICDGGNPQACDEAIVTIEVMDDPTQDNDPPIANNDTGVTEVNVPVDGNVLVNDFDPDGDPIVVTTTTVVTDQGVTVTIDLNTGEYTYTPPIDYVGEDSFEYTICDNGNPALCDTAIVVIQVIPDYENITVANDDAYSGEIDEAISGNVLTNDSDPEGDTQLVNTTVTPVSGPSNGTLVINPDGTFEYTPGPGFLGTDQFIYEVCDSQNPAACDQATVYISIKRTPAPAIAIVKAGEFIDADQSLCADEGETIVYTFTVTNQGNVELGSILITDPLLEAPNPVVTIDYVSGDDGDNMLQVSEIWIYQATYTITQGDIDTGKVTNQATVQGTDAHNTTVDDLSDDTSVLEDDPTETTLCQGASMSVIKNQTSPAGGLGSTLTYDIVVTNTGNTTLADIEITDANAVITGGNPIASLLPGASATVTAEHEITQGDIDLGYIENIAIGVGDSPSGTDDVSDDSDTGTDVNGDPILDPENTETPNGDGSTNQDPTDDPTVTILEQSPAIALIKVGTFNDEDQDGCSDVGETISYVFTVSNVGNVSLTDVVVTDPSVTVVGGPIDLAVGQSDATTFTGTYTITQVDIDNGQFENQAEASGTAPNGDVVTDLSDDNSEIEDDITITDLCQDPKIALIKVGTFNDEDQDGCTDVGETISYVFTVSNVGNVSLTDVVVTDPSVTVVGGPIDLAVGQSDATTFTGTYTITQVDIDNGQFENQAEASGTAPNGDVVTDLSDDNSEIEDDITITDLCQDPKIALIKVGTFNDEDQDGCTDVEETITYTFTVSNVGNVTLTNVVIDDPLVNVVGGPITLAPEQSDATTFTAVYTITQTDIDNGEFENQAEASGTAPNGDVVTDLSDDNSEIEDDPTITDLCQDGSIALIKTGVVSDSDGDGCADVKETITYTFTVVNTGNVTLTSVDVDDPLVNVVGGPITLAPGATDATSFTATYLITQGNIDAGFVENQATVVGTTPAGDTVTDESDDNVITEDDPTITDLCQDAIIALIKTATPTDENGDGCIDLGETIIYDFVVTNLGNVLLTNVMVTDPMVTVSGGPVTIAAGESDTENFSATYTVTQEDIDNGFISNQATAEGTAPNGDIVTDLSDDNSNLEDDSTITNMCQNPDMSLEKVGEFQDENGDGASDVGETISYFFSVTNTGSVTLYNITIDDPLPGVTIEGGPIAVLLPGETDDTTFTASYSITDIDIELGEVINQALVTGEDENGDVVEDESDDPNIDDNVDHNEDGDPDDPTITTLPDVLGVQFDIYNVITPNNDNAHDYFQILGIENWPDNNVKIYNRWGVLVFETDNYGGTNGAENVFRGISEARSTVRESDELPTGTYYYVLTIISDEPPLGKNNHTGYLYINR